MELTVSQLLRQQLALYHDHTLTLGTFLDAVKEQGFGLLLVAFALPVLVPLPPLVGAVPGMALILWGLQRFLGHRTPWLPERIRRRTLTPRMAVLLSTRAIPVVERMERFFPRRKHHSRLEEWESRIAGLMVVFMAFLLLLPTPFLNTIPAMVIAAIGLSFLNRHRVMLWTSMVLGAVVFTAVAFTVFLGGERLIDEFREQVDVPKIAPIA